MGAEPGVFRQMQMNMVVIIIQGVALLLQLVAAILALRLIWATGRIAAWTLLAAAIALIVVRRSITYSRLLSADITRLPDFTGQLIESVTLLVISILFVIGIAMIRPLFLFLNRSVQESQARAEHERRIAETLQATLLGIVSDRINGFAFETLYRAAREEARVGGDFYDVFRIAESKIGIVVGDVSGKGLHAAAQVAVAKYSLMCWAHESDSPSVIMEHVNRVLLEELDIESFVTLFIGILDCDAKTMTYTNAGHEPVMLWKAAEGQTLLLGSLGPAAGVTSAFPYAEETIGLQSGDELLLGTDGLVDVQCAERFLEIDNLLELYGGLKRSGTGSAAELVNRLIGCCPDAKLRDDVAILRVWPAD